MMRRKFLTTLAAVPVALSAAQEPEDQAVIDQRNLIAAMVNFDEEWMDFVKTYVEKKGDAWDIKGAAQVEKYFRKMTSQPGWVSGHKA